MHKAIVYYTDNRLDPLLMRAVQQQLLKSGLEVISVSLQPLKDFGFNIVLDGERGHLTMFRQMLAGIEASRAEVLFFAEHDVLYHPGHFDFTPPRADTYYYNENVYKVEYPSGRALFYYCRQTSGLCAHRDLLLQHYRKRVERVAKTGYCMAIGFEPGTHHRAQRIDEYGADSWFAEYPNIDLRHSRNLTRSRWSKSEFRNQRFTAGWREVESVPGWGEVAGGKIQELLQCLI